RLLISAQGCSAATTLGAYKKESAPTLKGLIAHMPNPFRVNFSFIDSDPGLSLRSNPGLKLANAFGVLNYND
ncbi:MAG TPA: hypothetical protein VFI71_09405, partial [Pyrinomonadaceae bacterium]|nr:hypothetical protein [Pyrinomonadaceae bacterium]